MRATAAHLKLLMNKIELNANSDRVELVCPDFTGDHVKIGEN